MREFVSKNIDGITDLIVIAPIKDGFIDAYDNITYATRLKLVAEALNRIRVAAREYERVSPYTDTIERILNILNFRITVLDEEMYGLIKMEGDRKSANGKKIGDILELKPKRYLCIVATFEGGWEPYMRLIWRPFGSLMDLLFCNCEDFLSAYDHSCEEYLQWVRDHLVDPSIFYSVNGLSTRDGRYLMRLERLQRQGWSNEDLAKLTMPHPDNESGAMRSLQGQPRKAIEIAFEALTVLYRLADYYPPSWYTGSDGHFRLLNEGHRLVRVAREILRGWDNLMQFMNALPAEYPEAQRWAKAKDLNREPLGWYLTGSKEVQRLEQAMESGRAKDPPFVHSEVQGGILKPQGSKDAPVRHGALLLFTIHEAEGARNFVEQLKLHFAAGEGSDPDGTLFRTIGFTESGLLRIGVHCEVVKRLPKEFREGMAIRSGTLGDFRENHSRNWILPKRNGPELTGAVAPGTRLSRIELSEVDFVIQLRSSSQDPQVVLDEIKRLASASGTAATMEGYELLHNSYDPETGVFRDHFGFLDGLSQPWPEIPDPTAVAPGLPRDRVKAGEVLVGYANDRGDAAPGPLQALEQPGTSTVWRAAFRKAAQELALNGSYLVLRKIGEDVENLDAWLAENAVQIAARLGCGEDQARSVLLSAMMGRDAAGNPLVGSVGGHPNDFDYSGDPEGVKCPFAAHVRRANPRHAPMPASQPPGLEPGMPPMEPGLVFQNNSVEFSRPTPRIVRRGMLFDERDKDGSGERGLMFMAYNASIAEQYEVIQRWLNGGNSTDVAAMQNDPLTGVMAREVPGLKRQDAFRFFANDVGGRPVLLHVPLPVVKSKKPGIPSYDAEPGRHPFTPLHWGLYLLVPSRSAMRTIVNLTGRYMPLPEPLEEFRGQAELDRLAALSSTQREREWKRLIEDIDAKDPAYLSDTPHLWSAIRYMHGGAINLREVSGGSGPIPQPLGDKAFGDDGPDIKKQNIIICAGRRQIRQVLSDWDSFSNEEQLRRMEPTSGAIYVNQRPDDKYQNPRFNSMGLNYLYESSPTNEVLMRYDEVQGFKDGYNAARRVLAEAKAFADSSSRDYFKIELRRLFLHPSLAALCHQWYGLPDGKHIDQGSWSWKRIDPNGPEDAADTATRKRPRCPGDFLAPSRHAYFPRPGDVTAAFGQAHGKAILEAGRKFVAAHRTTGGPPVGYLARGMFNKFPDSKDDEVLARTLVGTMIGALPPMDGNIRGILSEWFGERYFWRHQAALRRGVGGNLGDSPSDEAIQKAIAVLRGPVSQAMCKRPAPDLLYRTVTKKATIEVNESARNDFGAKNVEAEVGDLVIVSQVSAAQRSLYRSKDLLGDVSIVFGGRRMAPDQSQLPGDEYHPVHACPAQKLAMGAMMGILAALLDFGTVEALPASLIVRISDW